MSNVDTIAANVTVAGSGGNQVIALAATDNDEDMVWAKVQAVATTTTAVKAMRIGDRAVLFSDSSFTVAHDAATSTGGFAGVTAAQAATAAASTEAPADKTDNAISALQAIQGAVTKLGNVQGKIGTGQNRLTYAIQLAQSQITSFSAAESRIRDADVASEAANLTKAQVLQQASLAALAQANSAPQAVLSLLRG
jgi:flagellin